MKASQLLLLIATIYLAPHTERSVAVKFAVIALLVHVGWGIYEISV